MTVSEGGLGDLKPRGGERLTFGQAFAAAMTEVGSYNLGAFCLDLLANPKPSDRTQTVHGEGYDAVLGTGRGALQSFTQINPWESKPVSSKRIVCTFAIVALGNN